MAKPEKLTRHEAEAAFAETEGTFEIVNSVTDCRRWVYDPAYPVQKFVGRIVGRTEEETAHDWGLWLESERQDRPEYINDLEAAWLKDPIAVGPVTIAELRDGSVDIGDGWHRIAMAVANGMQTIPAIVGLSCKV